MKYLATPIGLAGFGSSLTAERSRNHFFDWRVAGISLSVAIAYYIGAKIGFALTFQPHPVSVLWPPNAILLAALLLTPVRIWWVLLLAAFPAHLAAQLQGNVPPTMILCWFISNSCEALIGAGCVRYLIDHPVRLDRLRNVGIFCFFAAFLGPFLSSFLDAAFVLINHWGQDSYGQVWRHRFTSNVLATLTLVPFIVSWSGDGIAWLGRIRRVRFLEGGLLLLGLLSVNTVVFYKLAPTADSTLLYLPLPFLIWATVRFGSRGASGAICVLTFLAIWSAGHGYGPFSTRSAEVNALSIQMFLIVTSVPLLLLAGVMEERSQGEMTLRERDERINMAAESANNANLELRLQREEMARLSRVSSMGELTASLAHELNQPLAAIASNAAAGRRLLAQGPPDLGMFEELLADVSADARRAGDIIHGIHHFVRKSEGTRRPIDVNQIVREVLRLLHSDLLGRGATVDTELAPNLPAAEADPVHLQQVLLNLLMNSLEAMQSTPADKRRVVVSTKREVDSFVLVSVRDYGSGLPNDDIEKVFTHFYSTKPNGMGMGLTIVRSIVEAHGGKLSAENVEEGALFSFSLPVTRESETLEVA
jgi:signal transduction histidine kinase